jgi:hypothetical protein
MKVRGSRKDMNETKWLKWYRYLKNYMKLEVLHGTLYKQHTFVNQNKQKDIKLNIDGKVLFISEEEGNRFL